ncbi:MAG: Gfo/Idh/MocA family oxidoreductase, partial [Verrucomicrobiota bacterium]
TFLGGSMAAAGTILFLPDSRVFGANERVLGGVVGCGGRGTGHVGWAMKSGADIIAVCDPDPGRAGKAAEKAGGERVKRFSDMRELFDDKDVDVAIMATPNHWHALGTVWACQAGKDVYVEKPASHSIWEGRKMVEAARKYKRMVQIGTQQRSDPGLIEMKEMLDKKELGEVQWIHSLWYASRGAIGKTTSPQKVPDGVDYDAWCGPRDKVPLMRKKFHYDWHWFWDYGNGDMGNRVIHVIDDVHHVMRMNNDIPVRAMAVGGRFKYDDDANTPNTEFIILDWKVPIIFGSRNMPHVDTRTGKKGGTSVYRRLGKSFRFTNLIKCENGFFAVTRGGGKVYNNDGSLYKQIRGDGGGGHMKNFFEAVKSRNHENLNSDVEQGHLGCLMLHTGNISYMIGKKADSEKVAEACGGHEEHKSTWESTLEHLKANGVDLGVEKPTLGPWLTFDPKTERFTGDHAEEANALVKEKYRDPYVIPEQV